MKKTWNGSAEPRRLAGQTVSAAYTSAEPEGRESIGKRRTVVFIKRRAPLFNRRSARFRHVLDPGAGEVVRRLIMIFARPFPLLSRHSSTTRNG
jgi:hypothetical protein